MNVPVHKVQTSPHTVLEKSFCQKLIEHTMFDEAVKLVKESYKLEVEADQSKNEFKIKADWVELLDLVEILLKSWLERKKKQKGDSIVDRIKAGKENPLLDISDGRIVWVFWGNLASELISAVTYENLVKELKVPSVDIKHDKKAQTLRITCNFEVFKDVKKKLENVKTRITSGQDGLEKSQKSGRKNITQIDGSKGKGSKDIKESEMKGNDDKGKSHLESTEEDGKTPKTFRQTGLDKSQKSDNKDSSHIDGSKSKDNKDSKESETKENDVKKTSHLESAAKSDIPESLKSNELNRSEDASGGQNLSLQLEKSDCTQDQSPHSSNSEDESTNDDKLLFRTPSCRIKVIVYEASIVNLSRIDAIVNAANEHLNHAGGVAYHISKAAGGYESALELECRNYIKKNTKVAVTMNYTSSAGNMPYKGVIHAVGPMWSDYKEKEECAKDLCMTIVNVLVEADTMKFPKIALPAISSGIFGVPKSVCAEMYIKGVMDYDSRGPPTQVREIHFVDINKDILKEIRGAYGRWKQNDKSQDKKAQSTTSGPAGQNVKTVHPTGVPSGNLAASQNSSNSSKMSTFQLGENTCVKVYVCSIVEVKNVDAIACEVDPDFSIKRHAVAQAIKKAGGTSYEEEFKKILSKAKSGSGDIFICKTGGSLKSNNIGHVIHIKCEKLKNHEDMDKLKHLYVQVFRCTKKEKMETIVMPLIGAASLKEATEDVAYECSQLFAKALKEVVESRGKEMNVKEIHLVDLNEKLISLICKAFQELNTANTDNVKSKGETKVEPVSRSKSDEPQDNTPKSMSGVGECWIKVEKGSDNCSYEKCTRKGTKKCAHCGGFLCNICTPEHLLSQCPFCKKLFD